MEEKNSIKETRGGIREDVVNEINRLPTIKCRHSKHHYSNFIDEDKNIGTEKKALKKKH